MAEDPRDIIQGGAELPDSYKKYAEEELKKPVSERWEPQGRPLASEFYGKYRDKIAIVVGSGHSLPRLKPFLEYLTDDFVVIAVSAAIREIKSDFWVFTDQDAYDKWGKHPNALAAKRLGVDRFWPLYDPDTYIWRRSFNEKDITEGGRLFHQNTSLLAAIHFAFKLGCRLVIMVGTDMYLKPGTVVDPELIKKYGSEAEWRNIMNLTFARIVLSIQHTLKFWKDPDATLMDASWGLMPVPKVELSKVIAKVKERSNGSIIGVAN